MDFVKYFKDTFESFLNTEKNIIIFLIRKDDDLLEECGFLKTDSNRVDTKYKMILIEQKEE